jgi:hypothetical protein
LTRSTYDKNLNHIPQRKTLYTQVIQQFIASWRLVVLLLERTTEVWCSKFSEFLPVECCHCIFSRSCHCIFSRRAARSARSLYLPKGYRDAKSSELLKAQTIRWSDTTTPTQKKYIVEVTRYIYGFSWSIYVFPGFRNHVHCRSALLRKKGIWTTHTTSSPWIDVVWWSIVSISVQPI